jgi:anti-anti-sigma factor
MSVDDGDLDPGARGLVVRLSGEVDVTSDHEIRAVLRKAAQRGAPVTVVDLSGVTFIDAHGIGLIAGARKSANERGRVLGVVGLHGLVAHVFRLLDLDALVLTAAERHDCEGDLGGQG